MDRYFTPGDYRFARRAASASLPMGDLFVTEMEGGVLRLDAASGKISNHYKAMLPSPPDRLAISPDGTCLAIVAANRIHLIDVASGKERFAQPDVFRQPPAMRLSPDGRFLLLSGNYPSPREEVWELATRAERRLQWRRLPIGTTARPSIPGSLPMAGSA